MKLEKVTNILLWVLLAISAVFIVMLSINISEDQTDIAMNSWINTNLVWTYILMFIVAGIAAFFAILHTLTDKASAISGGIALVFAAIVIAVAYALASDAIPVFHGWEELVQNGTLTASVSKWVGTTLYTTYILLGLIVVSIAGFGVKQVFSGRG